MAQVLSYSACPVCASARISPVMQVKDHSVSRQFFEIMECADCSLRFTQNAPSGSTMDSYYQSDNYISHQERAKGFIHGLYLMARRFTLQQKRSLVQSVTGKPVGMLLDIGAGTGAFLNVMNKAGWLTTGLEPSQQAREIAIRNYNVDVYASEHLYMLPASNYDVITMWHVLEHVEDLHGYLACIGQLLAPKGKLLVAVPNYQSHDAMHYGKDWAAYDVPRHLYHFTPASMEVLVKKHGLVIRKIKPMWLDSFYISMLSEKYRKGFMPMAILEGWRSNLAALFQVRKCSSLIYVIEADR